MPDPNRIIERAHRRIATMAVRGAGRIGDTAVQALAAAVAAHRATRLPALRRYAVQAARRLATARPTAVTLRNDLNGILAHLDGAADAASAKRLLRAAARDLPANRERARRRIARHALRFFRPGDVVLTHCHSTTAGNAIAYAARHKKGIRVFSTETRPFLQGYIQSRALARAGVHVTLIVDGATAHIMETQRVARVVVGADAVGADGSLYNKIGTRQVAELAKGFRIPFLVCVELDKFSPYTLKGERVILEERAPAELGTRRELRGIQVLNPVFDRTPPGLVRAYITENGVVAPSRVRSLIRKQYGGRRPWV